MKKISVTLDGNHLSSHDVCIGKNILDRIGFLIAGSGAVSRRVIISDSTVASLYGEAVLEAFGKAGADCAMITFPAGEESKNIDTVLAVVSDLTTLQVDRASELIALGGGVTGDIVSFVASIYMRSIPYVHVPTTLLAQVDSSIGGKTGINLPAGKNLLGTFHQPRGTYIDIQFLKTLPEEEYLNGLSEIVKYGVIEDTTLLDLLENSIEDIRERKPQLLRQLVERSCMIKKNIVEMDETDRGLRRILNFGHTLGHAVEAESGYRVSHGKAVALGMIASARISEELKYLTHRERIRIETIIGELGLPCQIPAKISTAGIISRLKHDKKKKGDALHFVLLKKLGVPFMNGAVEESLIHNIVEDLKQ
ncbi:MAG: 3-dehydroquinate synthase [Deltaproteobacteria bacterium]|nr:3-dehydroquinate synthase [Deltaproteobacteria bacterium]